jgi:hypothetical protein
MGIFISSQLQQFSCYFCLETDLYLNYLALLVLKNYSALFFVHTSLRETFVYLLR